MVHENGQGTLVIVENVLLMRVSARIFSVDLRKARDTKHPR